MLKRLSVIVAVIKLFVLGALAFGCVRTATSDGNGSQVDATEEIDDETIDSEEEK